LYQNKEGYLKGRKIKFHNTSFIVLNWIIIFKRNYSDQGYLFGHSKIWFIGLGREGQIFILDNSAIFAEEPLFPAIENWKSEIESFT
jgi:hypothetical protein